MSGARLQAVPSVVRRRHVLFFGGYDPKGASWYHAMYKRHAALQAVVNGMHIEVDARRRGAGGNPCWTVRGRTPDGLCCETWFEVAAWDAQVRAHWPRSTAGVLRQLFGAYMAMLVHAPGELLKVGRIAPRTLVALLWPLLLLAAGLLATAAGATVAAWASLTAGAAPAVATAVAFAATGAGLWLMARMERKLDTSLLGRIFAFVTRYALRGDAELDRMIDRAGGRIREILRAQDCDELLVVGYSVGSILATRAVGRALGTPPASEAPALGLLTLGNCIPMLGLFPQAAAYRAELAQLAASERLDWVDVSSPTDWGSFPLLDPLEVCDVELPARGRGSPRMTSPRFHTLIESARYARMMRDKHAIHALYLMSTDKPGLYDWFAITAGPQPLRERYAPAATRKAMRARAGAA